MLSLVYHLFFRQVNLSSLSGTPLKPDMKITQDTEIRKVIDYAQDTG